MKKQVSIGIDPGWKNLGLAVVTPSGTPNQFRVLGTKVFNPSSNDLTFVEGLPILVNTIIGDTLEYGVNSLVIERYVPYNNVFSSETENITMLIGMIRSRFFNTNPCGNTGMVPRMVRAIDWKIKLAQIGSRDLGFKNPSSGLDKSYSIAMAKHLTGNTYDIKTDHEADAICLAALAFFR